jgi:hypothetical protein
VVYTEHNYRPSVITHHYFGYNGTCVYSLKLLHSNSGYIPSETIVEAIRLSDDAEALAWMCDNGFIKHSELYRHRDIWYHSRDYSSLCYPHLSSNESSLLFYYT